MIIGIVANSKAFNYKPVNLIPPIVTGTPEVGQVLTGSAGTWTNTPALTYQWLKRTGDIWLPVSGQTSLPYTTTEAGDFRLQEIATNSFGVANAYSSAITVTPPSGSLTYVGTNTIGGATFPASDGRYLASVYTTEVSCTAASITCHFNGTGGNWQGCIWADNAGAPGNLLAYTSVTAVSATGWLTANLTSSLAMPAGTYWIGVTSGGYYSTYTHNLTTGGNMARREGGAVNPPGAFGTVDQYYESFLSCYANVS